MRVYYNERSCCSSLNYFQIFYSVLPLRFTVIKRSLPVSFGLSPHEPTKTNCMLTALKQHKLLNSLKAYHKDFLDGNIKELDESGKQVKKFTESS